MKLSRILIFLGFMTLLAAGIYGVGEFLPNSNILESKDNGYAIAPSGAKEIIIAGGSCRKISSTSATQYFIPTRTTAESSSFFANPPSGLTIGACAPIGNVCGTFTCDAASSIPWSNPNRGLTPACWNNFTNQVRSWNTSGYLTVAQKDQVIADGNTAWNNTCGKFDIAKTIFGSYDLTQNLSSAGVTGNFTLGTEEFAHVGGCHIDASVVCPSSNSCSSTHPACEGTSCSLTTGTPSSSNQAWAKGASSCGFTCTNGYTGNNCETVSPHCEVAFTILWVPDMEELAVGQLGASHVTSTSLPSKFNASCAPYGGAICTDMDPSSGHAQFQCSLPAPVGIWSISGGGFRSGSDTCFAKFGEYAGNISPGAACSSLHASSTCVESNEKYTISCAPPVLTNATCGGCGLSAQDKGPKCDKGNPVNISINPLTKSWNYTCQGISGGTSTACTQEIAPAGYRGFFGECIGSSGGCDWGSYDSFDISTGIGRHNTKSSCADPWSEYQYIWDGTSWGVGTFLQGTAGTHSCVAAC